MQKASFYIIDKPDLKARDLFACKLIEKAYNSKCKIYINASSIEEMQNIDTQLWTFRDISFIPHEIFNNKNSNCQILIGYNAIPPIEHKDVFGITFEQGRNEIRLDESLLTHIPTKSQHFPDEAKRDLIIALITLKYTQSNSVCYVKDGQAIGIGAGQQSRIHCTRLAGNKADIWYLRQHPKVMNLPWVEKIRRADRDNTIDVYISDDHEDVLADGIWQQFFTKKPEVLTREEKRAWLDTMKGVSLGSDAFFPFGDNIERAHKSGVEYIAQAGGSVRDDHVIDTCDKYGITMAFTGVRLFHH